MPEVEEALLRCTKQTFSGGEEGTKEGAPGGGGHTQGAIQFPLESQPDVQSVDEQQRFAKQGGFGPAIGGAHWALEEHVWPADLRE